MRIFRTLILLLSASAAYGAPSTVKYTITPVPRVDRTDLSIAVDLEHSPGNR